MRSLRQNHRNCHQGYIIHSDIAHMRENSNMSRNPITFYLRQPGKVAPDITVGPSPVTVGRVRCLNIKDKRVSREHVVVTLVTIGIREELKVEVKGRKPCVVNGEVLRAGETGYLKLGQKLHLLPLTHLGKEDEFPFTFMNYVPPAEETRSNTTTVNNKRKKPMSNAQAKFLYQRRRDLYGDVD